MKFGKITCIAMIGAAIAVAGCRTAEEAKPLRVHVFP